MQAPPYRDTGKAQAWPRGRLPCHPPSARFCKALAFLFYLALESFKDAVKPTSTFLQMGINQLVLPVLILQNWN